MLKRQTDVRKIIESATSDAKVDKTQHNEQNNTNIEDKRTLFPPAGKCANRTCSFFSICSADGLPKYGIRP